jgi:inosose dehydratase
VLNIGNAPLSWGVFEGDDPANPPWAQVLDEIVEAGYTAVELGPVGFLPEEPSQLVHELEVRSLSLTAGFVYEHMHDPAVRTHVVETTRRVGQILAGAGAEKLVVIDRMLPDRQLTAGRSDRARRLSDPEWSYMIETIGLVAQIARDEFGLRSVLHPHCGAHIEFADEIERALRDLPNDLIGLCIDTGHTAVAGMQAKDLVSAYPNRVEYFHFKDVAQGSLEHLLDSDMTFDEGLELGLFCALGDGVVDFVGLRDELEAISFHGSATVEQDPDPRLLNHSGLAAARQSLEFLRAVGLTAHGDKRRSDPHRSEVRS